MRQESYVETVEIMIKTCMCLLTPLCSNTKDVLTHLDASLLALAIFVLPMLRCLMPQCSGCSPCCTSPPPVSDSCYDADTGNWLPNGSSVNCKIGSGTRTCNNGAWQSNCVADPGNRCWDGTSGRYVDNNAVMSCRAGGTRMCSNGSWRVLSGECTAQDYVDENGNNQIIVSMSPSKP